MEITARLQSIEAAFIAAAEAEQRASLKTSELLNELFSMKDEGAISLSMVYEIVAHAMNAANDVNYTQLGV